MYKMIELLYVLRIQSTFIPAQNKYSNKSLYYSFSKSDLKVFP